MKEKVNVAELLKDCPKGMELDCIFTPLPHSQYKNIANKILKTQITFVIIGMCIGCALMYALITNNVIVI